MSTNITPLSILVDSNINLNNKGGHWLLLCLEEKQLNPYKKFSPFAFYKDLMPKDTNNDLIIKGYKAMSAAVKKELDKAGVNESFSKFVNKFFN